MCLLRQNGGHHGGGCTLRHVRFSEMQTAAFPSRTAAGMAGSQVCTLWTHACISSTLQWAVTCADVCTGPESKACLVWLCVATSLCMGPLLQSQQADGRLTGSWCRFSLDRQRLKCALSPPCLAAHMRCFTALVKDACEAVFYFQQLLEASAQHVLPLLRVAVHRLGRPLPLLTRRGDHRLHSAGATGPRACCRPCRHVTGAKAMREVSRQQNQQWRDDGSKFCWSLALARLKT